ncbi:tRNA (adenosine(37)-N6)-dimethylallyltransferase MiaA [Erythrobacter sp.]|uniref:tRNA (adenosine(37)-N6)-dimethylallyltransferase MiaA n=1 Tax=Erythrobacter sp. TaxID=1042 RepID=UPI003C7854C8
MSTGTSPQSTAKARPLAVIAGPTASGKSALAVALAQALAEDDTRAVVINADSAQVYADLAVLSARPVEDELGGIEHRLYGEWDAANPCSAAEWAARAKEEIADCHEQGAVPILVGGTGLYLRVLLEGIAPIPEIELEIREVVRAMPTERAYTALQIEDPQRAAMLEPGDSQRIARALEVKRSTGVTLGDWQLAKTGGLAEEVTLHPLVLMPERTWLYKRCGERFAAMVENGAIAEVEALLERGLSPDLPVMRAIGVSEIAAFLRDETDRESMIAAGAQATRRYAKRQFTWLRNQAPENWPRFETGSSNESIDIRSIFAGLFRE